MEKKSQKHHIICENYPNGCMWGLGNMLDFSASNLADVRHVNKHTDDTGLVSNINEDYQHVAVGVNKTLTVDSDKASEMSSGKCIKKQITPIKVEHIKPEFVSQLLKDQKKASKDHPRARDIPVHDWKNLAGSKHQRLLTHPNRGHGIGNKKSVIGSKHNQLNEVNLLLAQKSEAAEAFVNQKLFVGKYLSKDGANHQSKQFLDALEVLNSNKELFLKLLEDPNSLLTKHIQDLRDSQAGKQLAKSLSEDRRSECGLSNAKQQEGAEHTQKSQKKNGHSLFWKKIKWDRYSSKGSSNHQPSDTIEVSEPRLTKTQGFESRRRLFPSQQHQYGLRNSWQNGRNKSEHAMVENRKERHCIPMDDTSHQLPYYDLRGSEFVGKWIGSKIIGRSSPISAKLDTGNTVKSSTDAKRRKKIGKPKDFGLSIKHESGSTSGSGSKSLKISAARYSKQKESSIYAEAKRHLAEMLSNEGKDELSSNKQILGPLGTILSLPGHNLSSKLSPQWETEHGFVTAEMRFSSYSNFQTGPPNRRSLQKEKSRTSHSSPLGQNPEDPPCANIKKDRLQVPDSKTNFPHLLSDAKLHESIYSIRDDSSPKGDVKILETHDTVHLGESNRLEGALELCGRPDTSSKQSTAPTSMCDKNAYLEFSGLDVLLEDQSQTFSLGVPPSSPSSSIQETEDLDGIKDRADQTSPVSVLEPFPMEDVTSPSSIISKHGDELPMQRLETTFDKHCSATRICPSDAAVDTNTCMEDYQFADKYTREVLQAYGLNCDELLADRQSPMEYCNDPELLFDCINEVVLEVYDRYFRYPPWVSFIKPKIQPVPLTERDMVREIIEGVDERLLLQLSQEDHVQRDVEKSGAWLDIRTDVEVIVIDMVEASIEALIEETILEQQS